MYNCQLCEKHFFSKSAETNLCSETFNRNIKHVLEMPFLSHFIISYDFLNLNQYLGQNCDVKVVYNCRTSEKNIFFLKLWGVISCNKHLTDKIKHVLEIPFLSHFFIFFYFLILNEDFGANLRCYCSIPHRF